VNVICPKCLDPDAVVRLNVADGDTLTCGGCEEEYSAARVREMVASWAKVLPWIEAHPARTEAAAATT
jgi:hypothetical protein